MKNFPKVFVIILNYNGKDFIRKCLASVFKADYPNLEVVVVDNNSTDGSLELARINFSKAHFIKNEANIGVAAGNNVGIRFALERTADYILLLNQDTEVEKDFLSKLVEVAEKNEKIGIVSPVIFNGYNKKIWFSGGKIKWWQMGVEYSTKAVQLDFYETNFASSCAMLIKKEVFKDAGLLDEDYFLYYEDADFCLKAKQAGFKTVVVTGSWAYHFKEKDQFNKSKNKVYWAIVSGLIFFKKNVPSILKFWISIKIFIKKNKNIFSKNDSLRETVKMAYVDFKKLNIHREIK